MSTAGGDIEIENLLTKTIFYSSCLYCIGSMGYMIRNIIRNYSLSSFGSQLDVSWWKFWKIFGLKRSDYMKFKINIRTTDASEDCKINGEFTRGKLTNVRIRGSGDKCEELKKTKKIDK